MEEGFRLGSCLSIDEADYPNLPLYKLKGTEGNSALLISVFWLVFDFLSTWRKMQELYCNVADMADLADSVYHASPSALGTVCPALPAVPKISKNLVAYMACLLVNAPYCIGNGDTRAAG